MLEFLHVKPGKGSAFVRTKIKNLVNGSVQERTFRAGENVASAEVSRRILHLRETAFPHYSLAFKCYFVGSSLLGYKR